MFRLVAWKSIAVAVGVAGVVILAYDSVGLQRARVPARNHIPSSHPLLSDVRPPVFSETATVPAGTRIQIRLEEAIDPERKLSGERFDASLYGPLWIDGKFLAPSRSKVIGQLIEVKPGRAIRHSSLTIVLRELILNRQEYRFETLPLTIGATADPNVGAAVGSAIGSAIGVEPRQFTMASPIANGSQSLLTLTLSLPVELPVIRRVGGEIVGGGPRQLGFVSHGIWSRHD